MTISAKLSDVGGLEFVVSDPTDTDDVNGFSDQVLTVGGHTAKFSGGGIMQANSGKRIGLSQLKINTGIEGGRTKTISDAGNWTDTPNAIDGDLDTFAKQASLGAALTIDFGSIATEQLNSVLGAVGTQSANIELLISDDDITYVSLGVFDHTTGQKITRSHGIQTWRFVQLTLDAGLNAGCFEIFEGAGGTVTVRVRSSITQDGTDGTVIIPDQVMNTNEQLVFNTELLLTGTGEFITLEIVSFTGLPITVFLSEITSVKEV